MPSLTTDISIDDPAWLRKRIALQKISDEVLTAAWKKIKGKSKTQPYISVTFTNDKAIQKINKKFRGLNKPTNVLSFQTFAHHDEFPAKPTPLPIGDIVLALETIEREAAAQKTSFRNHVIHLLIHGFLHLCGYDHIEDTDGDKMENVEIATLKALGIKNPYAGHANFAIE